ncbi:hypothetical protein YC2023_009656 [Brassica napus]
MKLRGPPVRRKAPRNIPRENFLRIFRWTFRWSNPRKFRRNVPRNFYREFPRNRALGKFRGTEPSENSEEQSPRKIPRNESLGKFRGMSPSVYSEEEVPRYIPRKKSLSIFRGNVPRKFPRVHFLGISKKLIFFQKN